MKIFWTLNFMWKLGWRVPWLCFFFSALLWFFLPLHFFLIGKQRAQNTKKCKLHPHGPSCSRAWSHSVYASCSPWVRSVTRAKMTAGAHDESISSERNSNAIYFERGFLPFTGRSIWHKYRKGSEEAVVKIDVKIKIKRANMSRNRNRRRWPAPSATRPERFQPALRPLHKSTLSASISHELISAYQYGRAPTYTH